MSGVGRKSNRSIGTRPISLSLAGTAVEFKGRPLYQVRAEERNLQPGDLSRPLESGDVPSSSAEAVDQLLRILKRTIGSRSHIACWSPYDEWRNRPYLE